MKNTNLEILSKKVDTTHCVAAFFIRGREILIGLRHYASGPVWTTPGGRCDADEALESAIRRETAEEVGVTDFEIIAYLGEVPAATGTSKLLSFVCTTKQSPQLMEPDKFSEWKWCDVDAIPGNFINLPALELARKYILEYL